MNAAAVADNPVSTVEDLIHHLGNISPARIRLHPAPGTATVGDAAKAPLCELIDGVLVEKAMGLKESEIAAILIGFLSVFVRSGKLGTVSGESGMIELLPDQVRIPDVAFFSKARRNKTADEPAAPRVAPNLAVEVLSPSNTIKEMDRKRREYFEAGVESVWMVDPSTKTVRVYSDAETFVALRPGDTLRGEPTLPGFAMPVADFFEND